MPFLSGGTVTNEIYQVKFAFADAGSNRTRWTTNLYYRAPTPTLPSDTFDDFVDDMATAFRAVLFRVFQLNTVTVSTRIPDSDPYNANEFKSYTVGLAGLRAETAQEVLSPRFAARAIKAVSSGRNGYFFVRGIAAETDIANTAQGTRLAGPAVTNLQSILTELGRADGELFFNAQVAPVTVANAPTSAAGLYIARDVLSYSIDNVVTIFRQRNR